MIVLVKINKMATIESLVKFKRSADVYIDCGEVTNDSFYH